MSVVFQYENVQPCTSIYWTIYSNNLRPALTGYAPPKLRILHEWYYIRAKRVHRPNQIYPEWLVADQFIR